MKKLALDREQIILIITSILFTGGLSLFFIIYGNYIVGIGFIFITVYFVNRPFAYNRKMNIKIDEVSKSDELNEIRRKEKLYIDNNVAALIEHAKGILNKTKPGYYLGGTLCVNTNSLNGVNIAFRDSPSTNYTFTLNIHNSTLPRELRYWVCMCYVQYKGKQNAFYDEAFNYIETYDTTSLTAKYLLSI